MHWKVRFCLAHPLSCGCWLSRALLLQLKVELGPEEQRELAAVVAGRVAATGALPAGSRAIEEDEVVGLKQAMDSAGDRTRLVRGSGGEWLHDYSRW